MPERSTIDIVTFVATTGRDKDIFTVPTGYVYEPISIYVELVTDGTAGNRVPALEIRDDVGGAGNRWFLITTANQYGTTNGQFNIVFMPNPDNRGTTMINDNETVGIPRFIHAGMTVRISDLASISAADVFRVRAVVRRYDLP